MKEYFSIIKDSALFKSIGEDELGDALQCVGAYIKQYEKNSTIRRFEDEITEIGIVVKGECHVVRTDINGNRIILIEVKTGKTFGEAIGLSEMIISPVSIIAAASCSVIFIPVKKVLSNLCSDCDFNTTILKNLIRLLAQKSIALHIKTDILSQRSIREKLLSYFEYESSAAKNKVFTINFTREDLADYLGINRSAMVRELGLMQKDGIINFNKNVFKLSNK